MKARRLPSAVYLCALLRYEPGTGRLYWRRRYDVPVSWNARFAGKPAGWIHEGRRRVALPGGIEHPACRVIWKMTRGREPQVVDHINGDPLDERLVNLRAATRAQNARNMRGHSATGFKGVTFLRSRKRWRACIHVQGRRVYLGTYDDPATAHAAYLKAARRHFGAFARADCAPARCRRRR